MIEKIQYLFCRYHTLKDYKFDDEALGQKQEAKAAQKRKKIDGD